MESNEIDKVMRLNDYFIWVGIKTVIEQFLGENRARNYEDAVATMLDAFNSVPMCMEIHLLRNHLDYLSKILAMESDEKYEYFLRSTSSIDYTNPYDDEKLVATMKMYCYWEHKSLVYHEDYIDDENEENNSEEEPRK